MIGVNEGTLDSWVNMAKKRGEARDKPLSAEDRARLEPLMAAVGRGGRVQRS